MDDRRHRSTYVASVVVVRPPAHAAPRQAPPRTALPPVAGRYVLLDQVGAGGMGSVWRARDTRTGALVAVKVLGQHSAGLLARFVREQAVRVRHPHVVAPTGWAAEDDLVLLAMDLVPGGSVQQLLDEHGPLPVGYAARLVEQLLMALAAVHAAGLVHRDVKPANLLLDATGAGAPHLRLGDFGVAAPIADRRFTTVPGAIGTDGYMAPEQARGRRPTRARTCTPSAGSASSSSPACRRRARGRSGPAGCARSSSASSWSTPSSGWRPPRPPCACCGASTSRPSPARSSSTGCPAAGRAAYPRRRLAGLGRRRRLPGRAGRLHGRRHRGAHLSARSQAPLPGVPGPH